MALDRKARWSCLPVIATFVAGLMLCGQPAASVARTTAKTSPTNNCEEPLAHQPTEKPIGERGLKSGKRNTANPRSFEREPSIQKPAVYEWRRPEGRRREADADADACPYDDLAEGKDCRER
jgi:hypothetical protein